MKGTINYIENPSFIETALDPYNRGKRGILNRRNFSASAVSVCNSIEDTACYPVGCPLQLIGIHEKTACYPVGCPIQYITQVFTRRGPRGRPLLSSCPKEYSVIVTGGSISALSKT